jgi:hypothetical protein
MSTAKKYQILYFLLTVENFRFPRKKERKKERKNTLTSIE